MAIKMNKKMNIKPLFLKVIITLFIGLISITGVNANSVDKMQEKHLVAKISELKDSSGLVYVGAVINRADISVYLQKMKSVVDNNEFYQQLRANQASRDQQTFHVTLINPYEYQTLNKPVKFGQSIRLTLQGLGRVQKNTSVNDKSQPATAVLQQSYFVVVSSADGQYFRQQYLLKPKDFHITLGFNPQDIYDMSKGKERLLDFK